MNDNRARAEQIAMCRKAAFNPYEDTRCAEHRYLTWPCPETLRVEALLDLWEAESAAERDRLAATIERVRRLAVERAALDGGGDGDR